MLHLVIWKVGQANPGRQRGPLGGAASGQVRDGFALGDGEAGPARDRIWRWRGQGLVVSCCAGEGKAEPRFWPEQRAGRRRHLPGQAEPEEGVDGRAEPAVEHLRDLHLGTPCGI